MLMKQSSDIFHRWLYRYSAVFDFFYIAVVKILTILYYLNDNECIILSLLTQAALNKLRVLSGFKMLITFRYDALQSLLIGNWRSSWIISNTLILLTTLRFFSLTQNSAAKLTPRLKDRIVLHESSIFGNPTHVIRIKVINTYPFLPMWISCSSRRATAEIFPNWNICLSIKNNHNCDKPVVGLFLVHTQ